MTAAAAIALSELWRALSTGVKHPQLTGLTEE